MHRTQNFTNIIEHLKCTIIILVAKQNYSPGKSTAYARAVSSGQNDTSSWVEVQTWTDLTIKKELSNFQYGQYTVILVEGQLT